MIKVELIYRNTGRRKTKTVSEAIPDLSETYLAKRLIKADTQYKMVNNCVYEFFRT